MQAVYISLAIAAAMLAGLVALSSGGVVQIVVCVTIAAYLLGVRDVHPRRRD